MLSNWVTSNIRTGVTFVVGAIATWLAMHWGLVIDDQSKIDVIALAFFVLSYGYYFLVTLLSKANDKFGWLLGVPTKPDYPTTNLGNVIVANVRTFVPIAVGAALTWVASKLGLVVDDNTRMTAAALAVTVVTAAWYYLVHAVEQKWPNVGWLFGKAALPYYHGTAPPPA